jgi:hypothetical protein
MPPPVSVLVPFPCVVYTRDHAGGVYTFSHHSSKHARKVLPASLRVTDLKTYSPQQNLAALRNSCFLVLVAGDVARCVSVANAQAKQVRFLYHGSSYSVRNDRVDPLRSEFTEGYVPLHLYGTLTAFTAATGTHSVVSIESGVCLFPRQLKDTDVPRLVKWMESALLRSIQSSVWMTDSGESYNEFTLRHAVNKSNRHQNSGSLARVEPPPSKRQKNKESVF